MSQSNWSRIERGETSVTLGLLNRIAESVGRSPQMIVEDIQEALSGLKHMVIEVLPGKQGGKKGDVVLALLAGAALGLLIAQVVKK